MGNAISSCNLWNVSKLPSHLHQPCFSLWCSCPSWLLVSLILPLAHFYSFEFFSSCPAASHVLVLLSCHLWSHHVCEYRHGMGWCRCHLEWRPSVAGVRDVGAGLEQGQSSGFSPAELWQCQPVPTARDPHWCGVSLGKDLWGQWSPRQAAWSFVASASREQNFLHGYLFWESSKISGSQFNCATSQLPERIEYDHITWNACRVCYSNCISKRQHIWWLVLFGIISISWWCFIQKGCSLKG